MRQVATSEHEGKLTRVKLIFQLHQEAAHSILPLLVTSFLCPQSSKVRVFCLRVHFPSIFVAKEDDEQDVLNHAI